MAEEKKSKSPLPHESFVLMKDEAEALSKFNLEKSFKKGDFLLKEGQAIQYEYYIIKGFVRKYYLTDGIEKTTYFYVEGESISLNTELKEGKHSKFFLVCGEDCDLKVITKANIDEMFKRFPRFQNLCRKTTEKELQIYQNFFEQYMISTPEQRYVEILENRPDLIERVPQYHLASYLGVKPESLSRIRKRISKNV